MTHIRIESVERPFDDPSLAPAAALALSRADAMGLLSRDVTRLDAAAMRKVLDGMRSAGIGKATVARPCRFSDAEPEEIADMLSRINETLRNSPAPTHESKALRKVLGIDLLAQLTGMEAGDARTYPGNRREMRGDPIVERLHFLALLVSELAGSYTDAGVRRWFDRPRKALAGETPAQTLGQEWRPDDEGPIRVRELADSLSASPATRSRSGVATADFPFCGKMQTSRPDDGTRKAN